VGLEALSDYWYLLFTDDEGNTHTIKGTLRGIRRSLKEGLLGDAENVRLARLEVGPFQALKSYPEFRDLVIKPAKVATAAERNSDPKTKKPMSSPSTVNIAAGPATDSAILAGPSAPMPAMADAGKSAAQERPRIHLNARQSSFPSDLWKWVVFGLIFAGAGVLSTYLFPLLRHIRFF
jgi:hypothetical protein